MEIVGTAPRRERLRSGAVMAAFVLMIVGAPTVVSRSVATAAAHSSHRGVAPIIPSSSNGFTPPTTHRHTMVPELLAMSPEFRVGLSFSIAIIVIGGLAIFFAARRRN